MAPLLRAPARIPSPAHGTPSTYSADPPTTSTPQSCGGCTQNTVSSVFCMFLSAEVDAFAFLSALVHRTSTLPRLAQTHKNIPHFFYSKIGKTIIRNHALVTCAQHLVKCFYLSVIVIVMWMFYAQVRTKKSECVYLCRQKRTKTHETVFFVHPSLH